MRIIEGYRRKGWWLVRWADGPHRGWWYVHDKAFNVISGLEGFTAEGQMKKKSVWREHDPIHSRFTECL